MIFLLTIRENPGSTVGVFSCSESAALVICEQFFQIAMRDYPGAVSGLGRPPSGVAPRAENRLILNVAKVVKLATFRGSKIRPMLGNLPRLPQPRPLGRFAACRDGFAALPSKPLPGVFA